MVSRIRSKQPCKYIYIYLYVSLFTHRDGAFLVGSLLLGSVSYVVCASCWHEWLTVAPDVAPGILVVRNKVRT